MVLSDCRSIYTHYGCGVITSQPYVCCGVPDKKRATKGKCPAAPCNWYVEMPHSEPRLESFYPPFVAGINLPHQGVVDSYNHSHHPIMFTFLVVEFFAEIASSTLVLFEARMPTIFGAYIRPWIYCFLQWWFSDHYEQRWYSFVSEKITLQNIFTILIFLAVTRFGSVCQLCLMWYLEVVIFRY